MAGPEPENARHGRGRDLPVSVPWLAALCVWIAFIWGNSLVQGDVSEAGSSSVAAFLQPVFWFFSVRDPDQMNYVVRKAAHFGEYAVLGFLDGLTFRRELLSHVEETREVQGWRIGALALLIAVPVIDEGIQLTVPDRDGNVTDVLIDLAGACLGFIVALGLIHVLTPPPRRV